MSEVLVQPVTTRKQRNQFIDLPWRLYADDPNWMPPLRMVVKEMVGYKKHPFHDNAEVQSFVAYRDGEPCGRIAAIVNHAHNRHHREQRGFFGFYETIDDMEVTRALFDTVRGWFAEREITKLRGPTNPSMNYECGLLIDGFEMPPTFMMAYNPPYYAKHLEEYGFRKGHDLYAYAGSLNQLPEVRERLDPIAEQIRERFNVKVRGLDRSRFREDVEMFFDCYNRAMLTTWGFTPLPPDELAALGKSMEHLLVGELALAASVEGEYAGSILCLPDFNPTVKRINGRLFPLGWLRILMARRKIKRVRVLSINVVPEYQMWGLGLVLMSALVPKGIEAGVETAEFSWISEENNLARSGLEKGGATIEKTYRLYDYGPAEA